MSRFGNHMLHVLCCTRLRWQKKVGKGAGKRERWRERERRQWDTSFQQPIHHCGSGTVWGSAHTLPRCFCSTTHKAALLRSSHVRRTKFGRVRGPDPSAQVRSSEANSSIIPSFPVKHGYSICVVLFPFSPHLTWPNPHNFERHSALFLICQLGNQGSEKCKGSAQCQSHSMGPRWN